MKNMTIEMLEIDEETLQDIINIETGLLAPLHGFMNEPDFRGVVDQYTLADGQIFPLPITLDVPECVSLESGQILHLYFQGNYVADMTVEDCYYITDSDIEKVFCTLDERDRKSVV